LEGPKVGPNARRGVQSSFVQRGPAAYTTVLVLKFEPIFRKASPSFFITFRDQHHADASLLLIVHLCCVSVVITFITGTRNGQSATQMERERRRRAKELKEQTHTHLLLKFHRDDVTNISITITATTGVQAFIRRMLLV
jgi:hypothetical protein